MSAKKPGLDDSELVLMSHPSLDEPVLMPRSFLHPSNNADEWSEVASPSPSPARASTKEK